MDKCLGSPLPPPPNLRPFHSWGRGVVRRLSKTYSSQVVSTSQCFLESSCMTVTACSQARQRVTCMCMFHSKLVTTFTLLTGVFCGMRRFA